MPASSRVSRWTASSINSPGSMKPARHDHIVGTNRRLQPSQAAITVARQHDHNRIGARKVFRLALRAVALPGALHRSSGGSRRSSDRSGGARIAPSAARPLLSAIGGKCSCATRPCTAMERRSVTCKSSTQFQRFPLFFGVSQCGPNAAHHRADPERSFRLRRPRSGFRHRPEGLMKRGAFLHDDPWPAITVAPRAGVLRQGRNRRGVRAQLGRPRDAAIGISKTGFGTEWRTKWHASRKFAWRPRSRNACSAT